MYRFVPLKIKFLSFLERELLFYRQLKWRDRRVIGEKSLRPPVSILALLIA